jgi:hypothetical protein
MTQLSTNLQLDALLQAYCKRMAALNRMAAGNISIGELMLAERDLWAQLLSSPFGGVAVGLFGGAFVSFADAVAKIPELDPDSGKTQLAMSNAAVEEAAAQVALRVDPAVNVAVVRMNVGKMIAELTLVKVEAANGNS